MRKFSLVTVLAMVFMIPFPTAAQAACTQSAVVSNGSVTLCLNASKPSATPSPSTKTVTSVRIPVVAPVVQLPKPVKYVCPSTVSTQNALALAILQGCSGTRLLPPPAAPVASSKTTVTTVIKTTTSVLSDQAAFTPNPIAIVVSQTEYLVGESATLISNAASHDRSATLLGSPAQVRFVPVAQRWLLDGKAFADGAIAVALLSAAGVHSVELQVDYLASYRFDLSSPFIVAGVITQSAAVSLSASGPPPPAKRARPHLVLATCALHPSSYRC